jgi:hypothetical protein
LSSSSSNNKNATNLTRSHAMFDPERRETKRDRKECCFVVHMCVQAAVLPFGKKWLLFIFLNKNKKLKKLFKKK